MEYKTIYRWRRFTRFSLTALLVSTLVVSSLVGLNLRRVRENRLVFYSDTASDTLISTVNRVGWPLTFHSEELISDPSLRMADISDPTDHFSRLYELFAARERFGDSPSAFFPAGYLVIPVSEFLALYPEDRTRHEIQNRLERVGLLPLYKGPVGVWSFWALAANILIALSISLGVGTLAEFLIRRRSCARCGAPSVKE